MSEAAVCMPLGFGYRGPATTITWDGVAYACIPFRVEHGGISVVQQARAHWSVCEQLSGREVMLRADHALASRLRPAVSAEEARRLLAILESGAPALVEEKPGASFVLEQATRLCTSREAAPICLFLRRVLLSDRMLSFGERRSVQGLSRAVLGELAHVLDVTLEQLHARLDERVGEPARLLAR